MDERTFDKNVWVEIHKGNEYEKDFGNEAKTHLDLTKYNAANRMLDIESFHTFIHYLIARGPGGDHDGNVWDTRQKHWRESVQKRFLVRKRSGLSGCSVFKKAMLFTV